MSGMNKPRKNKSGKRKKRKDPNAPKRPRSAYILYCTDQRAEVKNANPDAKPADLMKIMGEQWNKLAQATKTEYNDKAKTDKNRYAEQMKNYQAPDADSDDDDGGGRKRHKGKKKKRDPNEPKRAPSAYLIYGSKIREQVKSENPEAKSSEIMKIIGQKWQQLTEDDKKPYMDEANAAKLKYDGEKAQYKKSKGHDDDDAAAGGSADEDDEDDDDDGGAGGGDDDDDDGDDDDDE